MRRVFGYMFVFYGMIVWVTVTSPLLFMAYGINDKKSKKMAGKLFWLPYSWLQALGNRVGMWLEERLFEIHHALSHRLPRGVWLIYGGIAFLLLLLNFIR